MRVSSEGPATATTTVKVVGVGSDTWRRLRALSVIRGQRIGDLVNQVLEQYLDHEGMPSQVGGDDDREGLP